MKINNNLLNTLVKTTLIILFLTHKVSARQVENHSNNNLQNYNSKLTIFDNKNNKITSFKVSKAISHEEQAIGLMNIKHLDSKYGMIFILPNPKIMSMWMKNTYIALDMIFIDEDNHIIKIQKNTTPLSLEIISSDKKVTKVLEINAGLSDKFDIKIGDRIQLY
ncbi:MAG: DUF192 domain-containing protein [Rickettsiales bacterium]|nr:DUF192 domain-containing protein [Rickettsiales bacterium]